MNSSTAELFDVQPMTPLDRRADNLRDLIMGIVHRYESAESAILEGPEGTMTIQEMKVIDYLGETGPRMMREIADYLHLAGNTITTIVDNLEKKQYARRQRSDEDRRIVRVELSDAGRIVAGRCQEFRRGLFRRMLEALTDDEQEIFLVLFRKIARDGKARESASAAFGE